MMEDRTKRLEEQVKTGELKATLKNYPRLFRFIFSSAFVITAVYMSIIILARLLVPLTAWLWKNFIDAANQYADGIGILKTIVLFLAGYTGFSLLTDRLNKMTTFYGEDAWRFDKIQENRFAEFIMTKMYTKMSRLPAEYFESAYVNDISERAFGYGSDKMRREGMVNLYNVVGGIIGSLALFLALYIYNPWLCLIAIIAPLPTLYTRLIGSKLKFKFSRDMAPERRKLKYYEDLMRKSAVKEIKTLNFGRFIMEKWENTASRYMKREMKVRYKTELIGLAGIFMNNIAIAGAAVLAVRLLTLGLLSLGELGAVLSLSQSLISNAGTIFNGIGTLIANRRDVAQLFEFLDLPEDSGEGEKADEQFKLLETRNIRYRYPFSDKYVLDGITLTIRKGEKIAFVGENGAGKTTFVKLLLGLLAPSSGSIMYNGKNVESLNRESYYHILGAVFQDYGRYTGMSIGGNVRIGDFSKEEPVETALYKAGLDGMAPETMLGKDLHGTELSVGEWQKLAIARGWYRDRDFLVLDEPTASLDPLAEEEIFKRLIKMSSDKTTILVTHRIGTATLADRIFVFDRGKIVEEGRHKELLKRKGKYAVMYAA